MENQGITRLTPPSNVSRRTIATSRASFLEHQLSHHPISVSEYLQVTNIELYPITYTLLSLKAKQII